MMEDIAAGSFRIRTSATSLTANSSGSRSFGRSTLQTYFEHDPEELQDEYYEFLVRLCGF